ncbi:MAG: hypothetical protein WC621_02040 [Patescibacteria group bacterium]
MNAVTIPKELAQKGDLVVIPREEYEAFSHWKRTVKVRAEDNWFWTPEWQQKEAEADVAIKARKVYGPFRDAKTLIAALRGKGKR